MIIAAGGLGVKYLFAWDSSVLRFITAAPLGIYSAFFLTELLAKSLDSPIRFSLYELAFPLIVIITPFIINGTFILKVLNIITLFGLLSLFINLNAIPASHLLSSLKVTGKSQRITFSIAGGVLLFGIELLLIQFGIGV